MSEERFLKNLAKYSHEIRTGAIPFNYRTGQCGPANATQLRSWGAACPPGFCTPDGLPEALNRYFAGDRTGCREIPYTTKITATTSNASLFAEHSREVISKVTMCPTRLLIAADVFPIPLIELKSFKIGNQNQLMGGPVVYRAFGEDLFADVPIVPDCIQAGQPFSFAFNLFAALEPITVHIWATLIGPAIG